MRERRRLPNEAKKRRTTQLTRKLTRRGGATLAHAGLARTQRGIPMSP